VSPAKYAWAGLTHSVYVTRVAQPDPYKHEGREKPVYSLRTLEAASAAVEVSLVGAYREVRTRVANGTYQRFTDTTFTLGCWRKQKTADV
jgi:hypothetical protein